MSRRDEFSRNGKKIQFEPIGVHVSIFRRGNRWYANFQHRGRQRRPSLKTGSKKEARRKAIQIEADLVSGRYAAVGKAPSASKVIELYREQLKAKRRATKTLSKYEHAFGLFIELAERLKIKTILEVDLNFVDAFRSDRVRGESEREASEKTIHNDLVLLRQLVNFALRRKMIHVDRLAGLELPKPKSRPQPCWTDQEVERILEAAEEPQRNQLTLLTETGMRIGELKWLTWDDVNLENRVIHVRPKADGSWKPKTGDIRAIPISPRAKSVLEKLPRHCCWVVTARPSTQFPAADRQISERRLLQYLKRVLKRLGLRGHLHTFRHSFISLALTRGIPEAIVRQWVGHVDRDTIKQYTHIADTASQAAMQRLSDGKSSNLQQSQTEEKHENATDGESAQTQHKT